MSKFKLGNIVSLLRNFIIRRFTDPVSYAKYLGVHIGKDCRLISDVKFGSEPYLVTLGNHVSITSSQFITHDGGIWIFRETHPKIDLVAPIKVGNNVFIGAGCIILPGVIIGDNVVVGAGSIVTKSLAPNHVYAGIPAKQIKTIAKYWDGLKERVIETKHLQPMQKKKYLENLFLKNNNKD